jgi:MarR-like DNA-binding transcriptional regulator SgrR of sgrS sRNA
MQTYSTFTWKSVLTCALVAWAAQGELAMANETKREIRTYMSYGLPIDPAKVITLVDLDFSYALGSPLVAWSPSAEPISALADSWDYTGDKEVTFHLKTDSAWSDGSPLTATDVVASLERAKRVHRDTLKSLYDLIESVHVKNAKTVVFTLNVPAAGSGIVRKLTEPMYGILSVKKDGNIDLTKTSGPYSLMSATETEVILKNNPNWYKHRPDMVERVLVRQPPKGEELQSEFLRDEWVNLLTSSSLTPESLSQKYKSAHFSIWNRNLDKVFFLSPGPRISNEDGRRLLKALNQKLNRQSLMKGMSGYALTDQFFLSGYPLFDPEFQKPISSEPIPEKFKKRPLEILGIDTRLTEPLRENLKRAIKEVTGIEPVLKIVTLGEIEKTRSAGDFDFHAVSLPVNDTNVEGALGYIFGLTPPFIPNAGNDDRKNFHARVLGAKKLADQSARNLEYRKVFSDAINDGCLLPLFHYSTVVIARDGLDLSSVPTTDETVAFSKVRFK